MLSHHYINFFLLPIPWKISTATRKFKQPDTQVHGKKQRFPASYRTHNSATDYSLDAATVYKLLRIPDIEWPNLISLRVLDTETL